MEDIIEKIRKGEIFFCPTHYVGAYYTYIRDDFHQCDVCEGYIRFIPEVTKKSQGRRLYFRKRFFKKGYLIEFL